MRGGWGCARILDLLDYNIIQQNPKIIMGYSDITSLLAEQNIEAAPGQLGENSGQSFQYTLKYKVEQ